MDELTEPFEGAIETGMVPQVGDLNVEPPGAQETPDFAPQPTYTQQQAYQPQFSAYQPQAFQTDQRMMKVYLALYEIIQTIMRDPEAADFLNPVNVSQFPQYPHLVQHPMDLNTVQERLISGTYKNIAQFAADTRLIFENAFKFNDVTSSMAHKAARMSAKFENLLLEKLLNPFQIQVVPTVSVPDLTPPAVGGLLARPKKLIGTPLGDFRKLPRHVMFGGKENHRLLPMRHDDFDTNAYLSHMKVVPAKKTFYTQKFLPYGESNPLTRAPSDFNYFYQQYVEYWAKQKEEDPGNAPAIAAPENDMSSVTDAQWQELTQITAPSANQVPLPSFSEEQPSLAELTEQISTEAVAAAVEQETFEMPSEAVALEMPVVPMEAEASEMIESTHLVETTEPAQPADMMEAAQPADMMTFAQPVEMMASTQPVDMNASIQPADMMESAQPLYMMEPGQPAEMMEAAQPAEEVPVPEQMEQVFYRQY